MAKAREIEDNNGFEIGKPYYCKECKRNHTKGKIYKEHLNFAQNGLKDEENFEDENIELNDDEYNDEFDNDVELIDASDELENDETSEYESNLDNNLNIESKDIPNNGDGMLESVNAVKKLPGVGEATLNKLIKAGFSSLESIAFTPPSIIQDESGLGEKTTWC